MCEVFLDYAFGLINFQSRFWKKSGEQFPRGGCPWLICCQWLPQLSKVSSSHLIHPVLLWQMEILIRAGGDGSALLFSQPLKSLHPISYLRSSLHPFHWGCIRAVNSNKTSVMVCVWLISRSALLFIHISLTWDNIQMSLQSHTGWVGVRDQCFWGHAGCG